MSKDSKKKDLPLLGYSEDELDDLNALAQSSDRDIIEESRRHFDATERLARTHEQLNAFLKIAHAVGSDKSTDSVLAMICDQTTQLMRATRTSIFQLEKVENKMVLKSKVAQGNHDITIKLGQGIAGTVAERRESINIKDVYKSQLFDASFDRKTGFRTKSCLCAPIIDIHDKLLGVVEVINKIHGYFTTDDEDFLASICTQIAVSLNQQNSFVEMFKKDCETREANEKLNKKNEELDMLYALERDAASASSLEQLIEGMLVKSLKIFEANFVGILLVEGMTKQVHGLKVNAGTHVFERKNLERLPDFLSIAMQHNNCVGLNHIEKPELVTQSLKVFGISLGHLLIVSLWSSESCFGALILGREADRPGVSKAFLLSDAKLSAIIAAHMAPSIAAHLDRQAQEKQQHLTVIGQMMSSLLHDMKTPLAIISGYAEMMVLQADDQKRQAYADTIDKQIEALKAMSAEILLFARGETELILRKILLSNIVKEAVELLLPEATQRQIKLVVDTRFRGQIECDEIKIQRVIINLAKNAMEAIDQEGAITILTYEDESYAYLTVQDDGPGIPSRNGDTIFDAFVSFGKKNGTGLGLSIVRKIVQEHKASITYQSVKPRGTAFVIAFPKASS